MTPYRVIQAEELEQMIERLRINVPSSIRESERLLAERDRILADAEAHARQIVEDAREQASALVDEQAIVVQARQTAHQVGHDAQADALRRSEEADRYAMQVLTALADQLRDTLGQIENGLEVMQTGEAEMPDSPQPYVRRAAAEQMPTTRSRRSNRSVDPDGADDTDD